MLCFSFAVNLLFVQTFTLPPEALNKTVPSLYCFSLQALVAVLPGTSNMHYFDFNSKSWKSLTSLAPPPGTRSIFCAETLGSKIFVAGAIKDNCNIYCYDLEKNIWEKHSQSNGQLSHLCTVGDYMYAFNSDCTKIPQRYSFSKRQWQSIAKVTVPRRVTFFNSGTAVLHSKVFVLYGKGFYNASQMWAVQNAVLLCFDPAKNMWEEKASTCHPHFGSSLFVVNGKLYVAGGMVDVDPSGLLLQGSPALIEVYDQDNNKWSIVDQKRIPQNALGAVEIEGRVYFIIKKFPIDSGIRIPPGEVYPVSLHKWEKLGEISRTGAALCYAPLKRESLNTT